jgi:hypothetical protein
MTVDVVALQREIQALEAVLADLKQDSTGYARGVQDGVMQERAAVLKLIEEDTPVSDYVTNEIRRRQPTLAVRPGDCTIKAGTFTVVVNDQGKGELWLEGRELFHVTMIRVLMRPGEVPVVDLSFHPLPRATQKG